MDGSVCWCRGFCHRTESDHFLFLLQVNCFVLHLGIESYFVGVHGPYELHRKEKQIKCTALATKFIAILLTLTQKCHIS